MSTNNRGKNRRGSSRDGSRDNDRPYEPGRRRGGFSKRRDDRDEDRDSYRTRRSERPARGRSENKRDDDRRSPSDGGRSKRMKPQDRREKPWRFSKFRSDEKGEKGKNFATSRENYDKRHGRKKFERDEDTPAYKSRFVDDRRRSKPYKGKRGSEVLPSEASKVDDRIRLNKYLANSGLCNRREADEFIKSGMVEVNGKTITQMGYKVDPGDVVKYAGEKLSPEKPVYLLLNKPKDFVTTMKDPKGRNTVMQLVKSAGNARVFPVGRLDRATTGLLMFTNDGDLAKKLTHPKHSVKKLYHATLDKNIKESELKQLVEGVELEDGTMAADVVSYVGDGKDRREVGLEIHSGKNRIVRRLFEALGYKVIKLDRVVFAGLTKKDLPRGRWRFLTEQEINNLKMLK